MDETEFVENLFSALCFALTDSNDNQIAFDKAGGIRLMLSMAQQKRYCKSAAHKVIDFAVTKCPTNCVSFVEQKGLKTLFAAFMGRSSATAAAQKKMKKYHQTEQSDEGMYQFGTRRAAAVACVATDCWCTGDMLCYEQNTLCRVSLSCL